MLDYLIEIQQSFQKHSSNIAFKLGNQAYTFENLHQKVIDFQQFIIEKHNDVKVIGVVCADKIETYALLLAVQFLGKTFVPLLPHYPESRNNEIKKIAKIDLVLQLDSVQLSRKSNDEIIIAANNANSVLSILFTSGSTGSPKGVPYTRKNINTSLDAYFKLPMTINENDRFLQMFDLNFDMAYLSFLPALMVGASVFLTRNKGIKYMEAAKVMMQDNITIATVVPSTLQLLSPYFSSLNLPSLKYTLIGGEPLYKTLANDWYGCTPSNHIFNISGPTETTMACMGYWVPRNEKEQKSHNGILAFGEPWAHTKAMILDENNTSIEDCIEGELAFAGDNVMTGYLDLPERNNEIFLKINGARFYKTGDMAFRDKDGIFHTCGRKDDQVKIMGFKVELGEIEFHARQFIKQQICVVKYFAADKQLALFIDGKITNETTSQIKNYLKDKVPQYMIPDVIIGVEKFAYTNNGKIDKKLLCI
ncbi:MAG: AMP-binding protein [Marinilabiliaceae bacterium]|nr:AMP-binding protein [Marinilabiliaceae bacterium]